MPQQRLNAFELSPHCLFVKCYPPFLSSPLIVGIFYHHRTTNTLSSPSWAALLASFSKILTLGIPLVLAGDANAHHKSWDPVHSDCFGSSLDDYCVQHSLSVMNSVICPGIPTFHRGNTVIDLCITSNPSLISNLTPDTSIPLLSDHTPLNISLARSVPVLTPSIDHTRADIENADWGAFAELLSSWAPKALLDLKAIGSTVNSRQEAVDRMNRVVISRLTDAAALAIPQKKVGPGLKHWWRAVPGVPAALEAYRRAKRRLSHRKHSQAARSACKTAQTAWEAISSKAKAASWADLCRKLEVPSNRRLLWPAWKRTKPSEVASVASVVSSDNSLPRSLPDALDNLASHYARVSSLPQAQPTDHEEMILKFVSSPSTANSQQPKLDTDFSLAELSSVADHLKKSAFFSDSVSPLLLCHAPVAFREVLLYLLNFSWRCGVLPQDWRRADVFPIYKGKGAPMEIPKSYRPISLTCSLVKLLERLLLRRLVPFLESRKFFNRFQAGFRRDHSTVDQLYRLVDRIQAALAARHYVSIVYLDIVAAFDTVWHNGLLFKLHRAGVTGRAWRWIQAFLSGRQLRVTHSNCKSNWFSTSAGVPQGSILGPILFLVFINDLPGSHNVCPAIFADDIALWPHRDGPKGVQSVNALLARIFEWSKRWSVSFSPSKSVYVCYNRKQQDPKPVPMLLGPAALPREKEFKYLGLLTHESLSWKPHTTRVISSSTLAAHNVCRVIHSSGPSPRTIRQLTMSTVIPIMTYAFPIWRPPTDALWSKLEATMLLPMRSCLSLPTSVHRISLLSELGLVGIKRYHQSTAVAFARRAYGLDCDHPTQELFFKRQIELKLPKKHSKRELKSQPTFALSLAKAEVALGLKASTASRSSIKRNTSSAHESDLKASKLGSRYKSLRTSQGVAAYVLSDPRPVAVLRARLRLNRANLNSIQFRYRAVPSPACDRCKHSIEDVEHVLLHCPTFAAPRAVCSDALSRLNLPMSVSRLIGDPSDLPHVTAKALLAASGHYLLAISNTGRL